MSGEELRDHLGVCMACGEAPKYHPSGQKSTMSGVEFKVFHDCQKMPGSPRVWFTEEEWMRGTQVYGSHPAGDAYKVGKAQGGHPWEHQVTQCTPNHADGKEQWTFTKYSWCPSCGALKRSISHVPPQSEDEPQEFVSLPKEFSRKTCNQKGAD